MSQVQFDYIVVGAGSSGCTVAARLSENGKFRVALIEAGPKDTSPWIHLPLGYGKTMWDERINWKLYTEPESNMNGRRIYWPRGKVLGGCSAINGLIAIRGQAEDYDGWARYGGEQWNYRNVLPYFRKSESFRGAANPEYHGKNGPISVDPIRHRHPLIDAFIGSANQLGIPFNEDFNGPSQEGVGYYSLTTRNGMRSSAAVGYLRPAKGRANLEIVTDALVTKVRLDGCRAQGIDYVRGGRKMSMDARRGVILSAGAVHTPHLMMLSGLGPADHIREHGINVVADMPGVGANLQDHLQLRLIYRCSKPITTNDDLNSLIGKVKIGLQWLLTRTGPLAVGINQGALFAKVMPDAARPDVQFHVATLSADMAGGKVHPFSGFTLSVCQLRPESRGSIRLASADPRVQPLIYANYLDTELDRQVAVGGVRLARRIASVGPLHRFVTSEELPGEALESEEDILDFARQSGATIFHPTSTCRMGQGDDKGAVVGPDLRVRGFDRLWIADCSVMPSIVSGNTNLPAIMIGEKLSDLILN
ncbi:GMC family oxidoreductase [Sinorhizobium arboris]|uniref:GMC family oxidoreductase n=1 Tax=Sinorhizobium arboris TaxID=76745 RepID=UPI000402C354|nr:GMC family oxidoreductase N-terminal domain-containing protein [Sinorhizobium arboris]